MKTITIENSAQVSGGSTAGLCLLSMTNAALGTSGCIAMLSPDMTSIQLNLEPIMPVLVAAVAMKSLYDLFSDSSVFSFEFGNSAIPA